MDKRDMCRNLLRAAQHFEELEYHAESDKAIAIYHQRALACRAAMEFIQKTPP